MDTKNLRKRLDQLWDAVAGLDGTERTNGGLVTALAVLELKDELCVTNRLLAGVLAREFINAGTYARTTSAEAQADIGILEIAVTDGTTVVRPDNGDTDSEGRGEGPGVDVEPDEGLEDDPARTDPSVRVGGPYGTGGESAGGAGEGRDQY